MKYLSLQEWGKPLFSNNHLEETVPLPQDNPYSLVKSCSLFFAWYRLEEFTWMCQKLSTFDPYFSGILLWKRPWKFYSLLLNFKQTKISVPVHLHSLRLHCHQLLVPEQALNESVFSLIRLLLGILLLSKKSKGLFRKMLVSGLT